MKFKKIINLPSLILAVALTLGLSISFQSLLAVYSPPLHDPAACNTGEPGCDAPLNVGPLFQESQGALWLVNNDNHPYGLIVENGKVGIGTIAPTAKVQINVPAATEGLRIVSASDYSPLNIRNSANTADIFRVDQSGILQAGAIPWARLSSFPSACGSGQYVTAVGASLTCATPTSVLPSGTSGQTLRHNGTAWVADSNLFNNGGNVGIGTVNPMAKLDVNGDMVVNWINIGRGGGNNTTNTALGLQALYSNTSGYYSTALGYQSLYTNTTGYWNTAVGYRTLYLNTTGYDNTAVGLEALRANTSGWYNTAIGNVALQANTGGSDNTAIGMSALQRNTTGINNTAVGTFALALNTTGFYNTAIGSGALFANISGYDNTAIGNNALSNNTTGYYNTASGYGALFSNTTGTYNTANGYGAMQANTGGYLNIAIGYQALFSNTTGYQNTANGVNALYSNSIGHNNTANGYYSLYNNISGWGNTANGSFALMFNTTGYQNDADGYQALYSNTTGYYNTAFGPYALYSNTIGNRNIANGLNTLYLNTTGTYNTAIGTAALYYNTTGTYNTAIGAGAGVASGMGALTNTTAIGANAVVNASNKIVLGNSSAKTVGGYGAWTNYSDRRLKENIVYKDDLGLNLIMELKPVSYNYKTDVNKTRRDGLIAQDVEQTLKELGLEFSGLVIDDDKEKTMNLSYELFVIPLIKATQEQQAEIEQLEADNKNLEARIFELEKKLK